MPYTLEALLRDPTVMAASGLRMAAAQGEADVDGTRVLEELLDFDTYERSSEVALERLVEKGEYAAAEHLLEDLGALIEDEDRRRIERRIEEAQRGKAQEYAEHARILLERVRARYDDVPPAVHRESGLVVAAARYSSARGAVALARMRRAVDETLGSPSVLAAVDDRARAGGPRPRRRLWLDTTTLEDAVRYLSGGDAPPGFNDQWRPSTDDADAWQVVSSLSGILRSWPPSVASFAQLAGALDRLLGGNGSVATPRSERGTLSVRLPALHLPDAPWFGPAADARGLLMVVPITSGAPAPEWIGPEELFVTLRLREGLSADRRAIRVEGVQLVPLLGDPARGTTVWRTIGTRTPLPAALVGIESLLGTRDGDAWRVAPAQVRQHIAALTNFLGLDADEALVAAVVQISGGVLALALSLVDALLVVIQGRATGRVGGLTVDDLLLAFWHERYVERVWSRCLAGYAADREAQQVFAAVRCAAGGPSTETSYIVRCVEVREWASMVGIGDAVVDRALSRLETAGLLSLSPQEDLVRGQRAGLALVAARKQGSAEDALQLAVAE